MKKVKMQSKNRKGAVMPGVKWSTLAAGLELVPVGDDGNPIPGFDPAKITSTLTFDPPDLVTVAPGPDAVTYTATRAAGALGNGVFTATITAKDGSYGPLTSTLPVELDAPPPPNPTDLHIKISGN